MFTTNVDYECQTDNTQLYPLNNKGASFMLAQSLLLMSYSCMVLMVFYVVPAKYRLIASGKMMRAELVTSVMLDNSRSIKDTQTNFDNLLRQNNAAN